MRKNSKRSGDNFNIVQATKTDTFETSSASSGSGGYTESATTSTFPHTYTIENINNAESCEQLNDMINNMINTLSIVRGPSTEVSNLQKVLVYAEDLYTQKCNPSYPGNPVTADPVKQPPIVYTESVITVDPTDTAPGGFASSQGVTDPVQVETGHPTIDNPEIQTAILESGTPPDSTPYSMGVPFGNSAGAGGGGGALGGNMNGKMSPWLWPIIAGSLAIGFIFYGNKNLAGGSL
jgi:hypothetical protein